MGLGTVAVYSDADERSAFVERADLAMHIGPAPSSESYLRVDKILSAAKRAGADAVHPGFGFLAENPALAEACDAAGLVFIGPSASVIRAMGSKREAKRIAAEAGAPVVPGYDGAEQSTEALAREAEAVGFPALLKASAGGGGKGMRIVRSPDGIADAIDSAKREAQSAFGDDTLIIERYIDKPRHIEVQILGDASGRIVHLFERECSIQRRHQKIIEETPSPAVDDELRRRITDAACRICDAVSYRNAGTVEFILGPDGSFYFLEMNTRLQVEHPVTELVTGVDIVREQIRIARGDPMNVAQESLAMTGAAIECRLYAEDPDNDFLPTSGRLVDWHLPEATGLRVECGVRSGDDVSIHYDPMLAKLVTHGEDREEARLRMIRALRSLSVQGITTNRELLLAVLSHSAFVAGETHTHFVSDHREALRARTRDSKTARLAAALATLGAHEARRRSRRILPRLEPGFRNNPAIDQAAEYEVGTDRCRVEYRSLGRGRFRVRVDGEESHFRVLGVDPDGLSVEDAEGMRRRARIVVDGSRHHVHVDGEAITLAERPRFPMKTAEAPAGACTAPMPGKVVKVLVDSGQAVTAGDVLVVLEAMKMEHSVTAPTDGSVESVRAAVGEQVEEGAVLVVVDAG